MGPHSRLIRPWLGQLPTLPGLLCHVMEVAELITFFHLVHMSFDLLCSVHVALYLIPVVASL